MTWVFTEQMVLISLRSNLWIFIFWIIVWCQVWEFNAESSILNMCSYAVFPKLFVLHFSKFACRLSVIHFELLLGLWWVLFFCLWMSTCSTALYSKGYILPLPDCFTAFVKNNLIIFTWFYFWILHSVVQLYTSISIFSLIPYTILITTATE